MERKGVIERVRDIKPKQMGERSEKQTCFLVKMFTRSSALKCIHLIKFYEFTHGK